MKTLAAVLCLLLTNPALRMTAQTAPQPDAATTLTTRTSLVLAPALVRKKSGELVFTLTAKDFVLTDDGIPQKLTLDEDADSEPLALAIVIENGGAGAREFDKLGALAPMLGSVAGGGAHRLAVVTFDSQPKLVQPFTEDADVATSAVRKLVRDATDGDRESDNGAAILDSLGYAVDLLQQQKGPYRRAILLISETLDRGSHMKLEEALRAVSDTNTAIYSIAFSTAKSEAAHYAYRELPTQPTGGLGLTNPNQNPPTGCMGKDPHPDPDATTNTAIKFYDCMTQLAPPLAVAKMMAIYATDALQRNVPETVANLTGGEYFKLGDAKGLEKTMAAIANHLPNRYVLSFQPQTPHIGLHTLRLSLKEYPDLKVTVRGSYWVNGDAVAASPQQ